MFRYSYECATPKVYEEFVNSFLVYKLYSSGNRAAIKINFRIVKYVEDYFRNNGNFYAPCIYNKSFGKSYKQAVKGLNKESPIKGCLFLMGLLDNKSRIYSIPSDVLKFILSKYIYTPSVKDFQCVVYKEINLENPETKRQILGEINSTNAFPSCR